MLALLVAGSLAAAPQADRAKFSLWDGAAAPAPLADAALEQDAAMAARAYDGAAALKDAPASSMAMPFAPITNAPLGAGAMFISVQMSLDPSLGPLKDALADLDRSAGFRPDPRFAPQFTGPKGDRATVWGWLPSGRLGQAMRVRGIERVEVSRPNQRAPDEPARARFVLGIRLRAGDETPAPQVFARVTRELSETADFHWRRTIGYQAVPGSRDVALVILGEAPLRSLGRMMAHSDVVKLRALADNAIPSAPAAPVEVAKGFLGYVSSKAPYLLLLTVLAAYLSLRAVQRRRKRSAEAAD